MPINFEKVNCDLCGSNDYELFASQTDLIHKSTTKLFNVVNCKKCGLIFTNPRPDIDSINNFYTTEYNYYKQISILKKILRKLISRLVKIKLFYYLSIFFPNKFIKTSALFFLKKSSVDSEFFKSKVSISLLIISCFLDKYFETSLPISPLLPRIIILII